MSLLKKLEESAEHLLQELKTLISHQESAYGKANPSTVELASTLQDHVDATVVTTSPAVVAPVPAAVDPTQAAPTATNTPVAGQ